MARRCDRPGCSEPGDVAYGFDATRRLVWLDRLVDEDRARAGALCARHAGRLTAPQGWWLDDRRVEVPDLFHEATPTPPPPPAEPRPPRRARRRRTQAEPTTVAAGEPAPAPPPPPPPPRPLPTVADEVPPADALVPFTGFDEGEDAVLAEGVVTVEETIVVEGGGMVAGEVAIEGAIVVEDDAGPPNALLTPSSPLLARAFTGAALPEPPHHRPRRNGQPAEEPPPPG